MKSTDRPQHKQSHHHPKARETRRTPEPTAFRLALGKAKQEQRARQQRQ